jgi:hypothetical protein
MLMNSRSGIVKKSVSSLPLSPGSLVPPPYREPLAETGPDSTSLASPVHQGTCAARGSSSHTRARTHSRAPSRACHPGRVTGRQTRRRRPPGWPFMNLTCQTQTCQPQSPSPPRRGLTRSLPAPRWASSGSTTCRMNLGSGTGSMVRSRRNEWRFYRISRTRSSM